MVSQHSNRQPHNRRLWGGRMVHDHEGSGCGFAHSRERHRYLDLSAEVYTSLFLSFCFLPLISSLCQTIPTLQPNARHTVPNLRQNVARSQPPPALRQALNPAAELVLHLVGANIGHFPRVPSTLLLFPALALFHYASFILLPRGDGLRHQRSLQGLCPDPDPLPARVRGRVRVLGRGAGVRQPPEPGPPSVGVQLHP
ncbi:hypothetical protein FA13DRAFT_298620 [Coprinellus micaceus]|uniref:Uncharacterized protein n=1 Tax=Coprinellus micaceus TaxID=71717 RepID=A0A4Y7SDN8_COPMI|nr:hypothetical protein FA13DRAFT_298620 [Coprinellus micaceus]